MRREATGNRRSEDATVGAVILRDASRSAARKTHRLTECRMQSAICKIILNTQRSNLNSIGVGRGFFALLRMTNGETVRGGALPSANPSAGC